MRQEVNGDASYRVEKYGCDSVETSIFMPQCDASLHDVYFRRTSDVTSCMLTSRIWNACSFVAGDLDKFWHSECLCATVLLLCSAGSGHTMGRSTNAKILNLACR